jgi:hypothetical protein
MYYFLLNNGCKHLLFKLLATYFFLCMLCSGNITRIDRCKWYIIPPQKKYKSLWIISIFSIFFTADAQQPLILTLSRCCSARVTLEAVYKSPADVAPWTKATNLQPVYNMQRLQEYKDISTQPRLPLVACHVPSPSQSSHATSISYACIWPPTASHIAASNFEEFRLCFLFALWCFQLALWMHQC